MNLIVAIAGGGPAGASLAIRLAQNDITAVVVEREAFPRHKLCGEFISPECLPHFESLGVFDDMLSAGGIRIDETRFYAPGGASFRVPSGTFDGPGFALSLSRAEMDTRLLERAKALGVRVLEKTSVKGVNVKDGRMISMSIKNAKGETDDIKADLFVDATGRSRILSKLADGRTAAPSKKSSFVGFKSHLAGAQPAANTCEIYLFPGGYGGLTPIEGGLANHCFLVRSSLVRKFGGNAGAIVKSLVYRNRRAAETLKDAEPAGNWLAVSVDSFGRARSGNIANLIALGDSAAFIDPFTGSGMLLAFESSKLLADAISANRFAPDAIKPDFLRNYDTRFARRLQICSILRHAASIPMLPSIVIPLLNLTSRGSGLLAHSTHRSSVKRFENQ